MRIVNRLKAASLGTAFLIGMSTVAFAAGDGGDTSSTPTCTNGKVYDKKQQKCVDPKNSSMNDDQLYEAGRDLAYAGRYHEAIDVLQLVENQNQPRVLNMLGYSNRKAGDMDIGMRYYKQALKLDPDYILTRSYMGEALLLQGDVEGAKVQLVEIRDRGGENTEAYRALLKALNGYGTY